MEIELPFSFEQHSSADIFPIGFPSQGSEVLVLFVEWHCTCSVGDKTIEPIPMHNKDTSLTVHFTILYKYLDHTYYLKHN